MGKTLTRRLKAVVRLCNKKGSRTEAGLSRQAGHSCQPRHDRVCLPRTPKAGRLQLLLSASLHFTLGEAQAARCAQQAAVHAADCCCWGTARHARHGLLTTRPFLSSTIQVQLSWSAQGGTDGSIWGGI